MMDRTTIIKDKDDNYLDIPKSLQIYPNQLGLKNESQEGQCQREDPPNDTILQKKALQKPSTVKEDQQPPPQQQEKSLQFQNIEQGQQRAPPQQQKQHKKLKQMQQKLKLQQPQSNHGNKSQKSSKARKKLRKSKNKDLRSKITQSNICNEWGYPRFQDTQQRLQNQQLVFSETEEHRSPKRLKLMQNQFGEWHYSHLHPEQKEWEESTSKHSKISPTEQRSEFLPSVDNALEEGEIMDEPTEKTKMFRFYTRHAAIKDNQKAIISFSKAHNQNIVQLLVAPGQKLDIRECGVAKCDMVFVENEIGIEGHVDSQYLCPDNIQYRCLFCPQNKEFVTEMEFQRHTVEVHLLEKFQDIINMPPPFRCLFPSCKFQGRTSKDIAVHFGGLQHQIFPKLLNQAQRQLIMKLMQPRNEKPPGDGSSQVSTTSTSEEELRIFQKEVQTLDTRIDQGLEKERKTVIKPSVKELGSETQSNKMLKETVAHLQTAFDDAIQDILNYKKEISLLKKELEEKQKLLELNSQEILKKDIAIQNLLKAERNEIQEANLKSENKSDIEIKNKELNQANEKVHNLETVNGLNSIKIQTLERDILTKESILQSIVQANSVSKVEYESELGRLLGEIESKNREIKECEQRVVRLEALDHSNAEKIQILEKSILTKDIAIQRILHKHSVANVENESKLEMLLHGAQLKDKENESLNKKVQNMETVITLNGEKIPALEKSISEKDKKIQDLLTTLFTNKAEHESSRAKLERELCSKNRKVDEFHDKIKNLETQIILKNSKIGTLTAVEVVVKVNKETSTEPEAENKTSHFETELKHCKERIQKLREKLTAGSRLASEHAKLVRFNKILEKKLEESLQTKPLHSDQSYPIEKLLQKLSHSKQLLKLRKMEIQALKQSSTSQ